MVSLARVGLMIFLVQYPPARVVAAVNEGSFTRAFPVRLLRGVSFSQCGRRNVEMNPPKRRFVTVRLMNGLFGLNCRYILSYYIPAITHTLLIYISCSKFPNA